MTIRTDAKMAFQEAIDHAERSGMAADGFVLGNDTDIAALGSRLGVRLPPSYKAMVDRYGTVSIENLEIYGLTKPSGLDAKGVANVANVANVVFVTEKARRRGLIAAGMILFMTSGDGPAYLFDCGEADEFGEAPVYEFPAGGIAYGRDRVASSFGHFVLDEVKNLGGS